MDAIIRGMQHVWPTGVNFAYVAPTQKQAKLVAWPYLKEFAVPLPDPRSINETELRMELVSGARIHVFGAESADNLRGIGLSGVVLDEFASMPPSVWGEIVRPMLSDRGGWGTIIGTPKGRSEFFRIYEEALADSDRWFSLKLKASESGILPEHELADLRHMYRETPIRMFLHRGDMRRLFRQTASRCRGAGAHHDCRVRPVAPCGHCMGLRDRGRYGHLGISGSAERNPGHRLLPESWEGRGALCLGVRGPRLEHRNMLVPA